MRWHRRSRKDEKMIPWREHYVTTRRHPLAFASYLVSFAFGLIFVLGLIPVTPVFAAISPLWRIAWEWELLSGGAAGVLAILLRPRLYPEWPDLADMLRFEGIGAFVAGVGMFTYSVILVEILGWDSYSWALMSILGLGLCSRAIQAIIESTRVERLGALNDAAQHVLREAHRVHIESGAYDHVDQDNPTARADAIMEALSRTPREE